jgi:hypothetical protein
MFCFKPSGANLPAKPGVLRASVAAKGPAGLFQPPAAVFGPDKIQLVPHGPEGVVQQAFSDNRNHGLGRGFSSLVQPADGNQAAALMRDELQCHLKGIHGPGFARFCRDCYLLIKGADLKG